MLSCWPRRRWAEKTEAEAFSAEVGCHRVLLSLLFLVVSYLLVFVGVFLFFLVVVCFIRRGKHLWPACAAPESQRGTGEAGGQPRLRCRTEERKVTKACFLMSTPKEYYIFV